MGDDDFVNAQLARWNVERLWYRSVRVKINPIAIIQNVALSARRRAYLFGDRFLLPSLPGEMYIIVVTLELAAFAIKKDKDVVVEHGNEITKLLAISLERICVRPRPQERTVAQARQVLFGRGVPNGLLNRRSNPRR